MLQSTTRRLASKSSWICTSCRRCAPTVPSLSAPQRGDRCASTTRKAKLPETPARTRFAPSPTGNLHLGSLRTALFNFLLARKTNGQFLLRVEDTDQKRTVPGAEERLYEDLQWAGLQWDEGPLVGGAYGPYRQSERLPVYKQHIQTLLKSGAAYRCFCSAERIDSLNRLRHDKGLPLGYDRKCAHISLEQAEERASRQESHVVRFRIPQEYPKFNDLVYGKTGHGKDKMKKMQFDEPVYDDPILVKSDGYPTYHFANVVDDQLMRITHVIRGSEWMSSTPLHVALYEAFGWQPPLFGHVPLLVDKNGQKLSKRNFDTDMASYKKAGVYPEALINFASLLGWSHQNKTDVMDLKDLEGVFDLKFTRGNTIVDFEKLSFLQKQHAKRKIQAGGAEFDQMVAGVATALTDKFGTRHVATFVGDRQLKDVIASMLRAETIANSAPEEHANRCAMFLESLGERPRLEVSDATDTELLEGLRSAAATLCETSPKDWNKQVHRARIGMTVIPSGSTNGPDLAAHKKKTMKDLYHYLRWALMGGQPGPTVPETMEILGRDICRARLNEAGSLTMEQDYMTRSRS